MSQKTSGASGRSSSKAATTPNDAPSVTPPMGYDGHSFILQAIMDNQKALGRLEQSIENIQTDIKDLNSTLSGHSRILHIATGAVVIISLMGGFAINAAWPKIVQLMSMDIPRSESYSNALPPGSSANSVVKTP